VRTKAVTDDEECDQTDFDGAIETARLKLLPLNSATAAAAAFIGTDFAEIAFALPAPVLGGAGEARAIVEKNSDRAIGATAYGPMFERSEFTEVGCWIGKSHRGLGYATEAAQAIIDRAFAGTAITVLWCVNRVMNAEARRVIEKCGFQFRETGMARSPNSNGAVPVDRFALDRRNWLALHKWGGRPRGTHFNGETRDTAA
jgi:RimJ/RimL family protein N-acetyltransferase